VSALLPQRQPCHQGPPSSGPIRREALGYEALSADERRIRIQDARASNPRQHRLFPWVDPIGAILKISGSYWTVVEEANLASEGERPAVYQVVLNSERGALVLGPFREPSSPPAAGPPPGGGVR
jgi:hypothetical protein